MSSASTPMDEPIGTPFMLPGMSSPEVEDIQLHIDSGGRVVRFDHECVLIPELNSKKQRSAMVITKSYSLPFWKKRGGSGQPTVSDSEPDAEEATQTHRGSARSPSPSEDRLVIKVPIPTFRRRSSRSPTRGGRSVSASPAVPSRLPPCLVHRDTGASMSTSTSLPSPSSLHPGMPIRRPSLPTNHRRRDDCGFVQTVPLRECCQACETITEESLKLGESWQEKFSRGARRRRSASLDHQEASSSIAKLSNLHTRTASLGNCVSGICGVEPSSTSKLTLTVDEVDKRRKSVEMQERPPFFSCPSTSSASPAHEQDSSSSSTATTSTMPSSADENLLTDLKTAIPDTLMGSPERHRLYRSSPIQEEDEAQLFPLPRRSPSGTPSPKVSPAHSPNASAVCLTLPSEGSGRASSSRKASGSRESVASNTSSASNKSGSSRLSPGQSNSSHESLLKASLSRKPSPGVGMGYAGSSNNGRLSVPSTPTGSRNSSPTSRLAGSATSIAKTSPAESKTSLRISTTSAMSTTAKTTGRISQSTSVKEKGKDKPVPSLPVSPSRDRTFEKPLPSPTLPSTPEDATLSLSASFLAVSTSTSTSPPLATATSQAIFPSSSSPFSTPISPRLSPTSPRSPDPIIGSPSSPSSGTMGRRKLSLTAPFLKAGGALRGVSADVLKGVSSFGGGQF